MARKRTVVDHAKAQLRDVARWCRIASGDLRRADRIDALDSMDIAMRRLTDARKTIADTLPASVQGAAR